MESLNKGEVCMKKIMVLGSVFSLLLLSQAFAQGGELGGKNHGLMLDGQVSYSEHHRVFRDVQRHSVVKVDRVKRHHKKRVKHSNQFKVLNTACLKQKARRSLASFRKCEDISVHFTLDQHFFSGKDIKN